jgi:hypothetical protein
MNHLTHLKDIVVKNKYKIIFTYTLLFTEYIVFALIPFLMGKSIDSLLNNDFYNFYVYISMSFIGLFVGTFRRRIDTRTFVKVWHEKTYGAIELMVSKKIEPSKIISRSAMARTYGDFLEHTFPMLIQSVIDIVVAIIMIGIIVPKTAAIVFSMVVFVIAMQCVFSQWIRNLEVDAQKIRETNNSAILESDLETVYSGQKKLMKLYVRISDLEASCWRFAEFLTIICEVLIVFTLIRGHFTAGMIMSTITYGRQVFLKTNFLIYLFGNIRQMQVFEEFIKSDD